MFKIYEIQKKNADWVVVSLVDAAGDIHENVSINKVSKKDDVFPNFDSLDKGSKVEGRIWESDAKKKYLFAPKGGAKAPYKSSEAADRAYDKKFDAQAEEQEYPVSAKLETILNKMVRQQIQLEQILELLQPKKKAPIDDIPDYPNDIDPDLIPF